MSEQLMYLCWNDKGSITRMSGQEIPNSIAVPIKAIEDVVLGKENISKYKIKFNTEEKKYELVDDENFELMTFRIKDSIHKINPNTVSDYDFKIVQDTKNKTWTFKLVQELNVVLGKDLWFACTQKDNPNIVLRTFFVNLKELTENEITVGFINDKEESNKDVSIFTAKAFDRYSYIQV